MLRFEPIQLTCWPALSALSLFAAACDLSSSKEESASMVLFTVLQVSAQVSTAEAKADPAAADPADPTVAGSCGFSYWSRLDPL